MRVACTGRRAHGWSDQRQRHHEDRTIQQLDRLAVCIESDARRSARTRSATLAVDARYASSLLRSYFSGSGPLPVGRPRNARRSPVGETNGTPVTRTTPLRTPATYEQCRRYGAELVPGLTPYAKRYPAMRPRSARGADAPMPSIGRSHAHPARLRGAGNQVARACHLPACTKVSCCRHARGRSCRPWRRWEPQAPSQSADTGLGRSVPRRGRDRDRGGRDGAPNPHADGDFVFDELLWAVG